ncbi:hypothetical protein AK830_g7192 [Neonectria ditissima]|uniref:Starter acyltransferase (SAT) domain-containing protein n=1 Tax=Neonectria ditissima TaxID=78410 RepID=A0A0P7BGC0_9HYPO|nr:hypothetical protein AK830_g7192 [Neonectria ditissima]
MSNCRILFFGDQTETDFGIEELLNHAGDSKHLKTYLDEALRVSREIVNGIDEEDPRKLRFDTLSALVGRVEHEESPPIVLRALTLCFAQLGHLIIRLEKDSTLRELWADQKLLVVASCAGQLPASLAATARSIDDLVKAAPEILALTIRAALDADRKTDAVGDDRTKSWAYAVFGISMPQAVDAAAGFNLRKGVASASRLYIGATSAWATTVIGPPSFLAEFFAADPFPGKRAIALPIHTLFHAEHLEKPNIREMIGTAPNLERLRLEETCFISSSSALPFVPQGLRDLAGEAVLNINARVTDNTKVFAAVKGILGGRNAVITPIVAKKGAARLVKALGEETACIEDVA